VPGHSSRLERQLRKTYTTITKPVFAEVREMQRRKSNGKTMGNICKCVVVSEVRLRNLSALNSANLQCVQPDASN
jgi:hypothetical protein